MKRTAAVILLVVLLCSVITPASADSSFSDATRFTYIRSATALLDINTSEGIADCFASCQTNAGYSNLTIKVTCSLQQYNSGNWNQVAFWSKTGSVLVSLNRQRAIYSGYTYRLVSKFYIYNSTGAILETHTIYSY